MLSPALAQHASDPAQFVLPRHTPLAVLTRDGLVEGVHYGSLIATAPDGGTLLEAGDPLKPFYPRSSLKPLQAVALVRGGLNISPELLGLTAASHSGAAIHREGALRILELHGLTPAALENTRDLPYGTPEREEWLRNGGEPSQLAQNCSGKHAAMAATCVINGWPVRGYLDPGHPLQKLVADTIGDLTGEEPAGFSTDGCGTPLFALTLLGMARAFGRIAAAATAVGPEAHPKADTTNASPEAAVACAMARHPEMVAGDGRDVTELMHLIPGLVAKDGFEGVQLVGLPDGRGIAVKISDGGDRARMPVTVRVLDALDVDTSRLAGIATAPVLGGGRQVGLLQAADFLLSDAVTPPTPNTSD